MVAAVRARISLKRHSIIKNVSFDSFCFWFAVIDILFIPYFKWFSVSFSVPLVFLWMIKNWTSVSRREEGAILGLIALAMIGSILVSLFYSYAVRWDTSLATTVKRSIQYFICMGYYLFFASYFKKHNIDINRTLSALLLFIAAMAVIYHFFPTKYASIKISIYPADAHTKRFLNNELGYYRFNYLLVDPNNVAYLVDGVLAWLLVNSKTEFRNKVILILIASFSVLSTQSSGGIIILILVLLLWSFSWIDIRKNAATIRKSIVIGVLGLIILSVLIVTRSYVLEFLNVHLIDKVRVRIDNYGTQNGLDISGGRAKDFFDSLSYLHPIMLAIGSGKEGITSESGHLYLIGFWGFPAYIAFLWYTFRIKKKHLKGDLIWMLPFFIGFTMNIAIGEFKWLAIYFLILAKSRTAALAEDYQICDYYNG